MFQRGSLLLFPVAYLIKTLKTMMLMISFNRFVEQVEAAIRRCSIK